MIKLMKVLSIIAICLFGIVKCIQSDWFQAQEREKAAEIAEMATPKIVSKSDDGCVVYSFYTDTTHYFTRCGSTTTTDRQYTVHRGKSSQTETESIVTESKGHE